MSKKTVNLKKGEDGVYRPEGKESDNENERVPKYKDGKEFNESYVDDFLSGVDIGLDFIDKVVPRLERIAKLRE